MVSWKEALERSSTTGYAYADQISADEQPKLDDVPGDIHEIFITEENSGKYSIILTVLMDDAEEVSEEEINRRLRALGANPNAGWE